MDYYYKFGDWLIKKNRIKKLNLEKLCLNEHAIPYIEKQFNIEDLNQECLKNLCKNPNAINYLNKIFDNNINIHFLELLVLNVNGLSLIEKNIDNLNSYCWLKLCKRKDAFYLIEKNYNKLSYYCWQELCNYSYSIDLIEKNIFLLDKSCYDILSEQYFKVNNSDYKEKLENILSKLAQHFNDHYHYELNIHEDFYNNILHYSDPKYIKLINNNLNYIDTLQFHEQIKYYKYIFKNPEAKQIIKNFLKRYKPLLLTNNSELKLEYKSLIKELKSIWSFIAENPNGIEILEENIMIIKNYLDKKNIYEISKALIFNTNPKAIEFLKKNNLPINSSCFNGGNLNNKESAELLDEYLVNGNKFCLDHIRFKTNKFIIPIFKKYFRLYYHQLNWHNMCYETDNTVIDFIKENIYYLYDVCWIILAKNKNYNARLLVQNNYQKFKKNNDFWNSLHYINNETSLYLFNKYRSKIDLNKISSNPIIFDYNYKNIKDSKKIINQEIKRKYYYLDKQKYINYYNCNIILSYL